MPTPSKNAKNVPVPRTPRNSSGVHAPKRHAARSGREEWHLGAREDQISVTMPPKEDDDEPKQG